MSTILYSEQRENGDVLLLCESCYAPTDWVTPNEAAHMAIKGYHIFCMECDQYEADSVPKQLVPLYRELMDNLDDRHEILSRHVSPLASIPYLRVFSAKGLSVSEVRQELVELLRQPGRATGFFERVSENFKTALVKGVE